MTENTSKIVTTLDFLDLISAKTGITSVNGLAKLLGVARQTIYHYKKGGVMKEGKLFIRVAELTDTRLTWVTYNLMAEDALKSNEPDVAESFVQYAQKYKPALMALSACFCLFFFDFGQAAI